MTATEKNNQNKKQRYFPSSFLIIFGLMFVFIVISWILHASGIKTEVVSGGTKTNEKIVGLGIFDIFAAIWRGFINKADVILFILSIGGLLGVMARTKAIDAGIANVVKKLNGKEVMIIPVLMIIFGLGGTSYGMWEETIAFYPILIPVFSKAKLGSFTAVMTILVGAGTGCLASTINPFATSLAFSSAGSLNGLPSNYFGSGIMLGERWLAFIIFQSIAIAFVTYLGVKTRKNNLKIEGLDYAKIDKKFSGAENIKFTKKMKIALSIFIFGFVFMILSYLPWSEWIKGSDDPNNSLWSNWFFWISTTQSGTHPGIWETWGGWGFISIAAMFFLIAIIVFFVCKDDFIEKDENKETVFINTFISGAKDVLSVCLLIATAQGLAVILSQSNIGPLIANSFGGVLKKVNLVGFAVIMFIVCLLLSTLVPSTSAFAGAFIPIFGATAIKIFGATNPHDADAAIGLLVAAFVFGSGVANLFTPTSAALMAYTAYSEVPYPVWLKQIWKILVVYTVVSIVLLVVFALMAGGGIKF